MVRGIDNLDPSLFFEKPTNERTRSNGYKIFKKRCQYSVRANAFSQRVVDQWNDLPSNIVDAPTLNHFKSELRKHWADDPAVHTYPYIVSG